MIEVRIILHPGGDRSRAKTLHTIGIANMSDLADVSDYRIECASEETNTFTRAEVQHTRSDGVLALVERALYKLRRKGVR